MISENLSDLLYVIVTKSDPKSLIKGPFGILSDSFPCPVDKE